MKTVIQFKRGNAASIAYYTGAVKGEPILDIENCMLYVCTDDYGTLSLVDAGVGSNSSANAVSLRSILIQDTQPQDRQALIYNSISNQYEPHCLEDTLLYVDGGSF